MLILGPEICHVDRCPHGCTSETGCSGHEQRRRAPEHYAARLADLIAEAARWGVDLSAPSCPYIRGDHGSHWCALAQATTAVPRLPAGPAPRFPTMLRKLWTGAEVQAWLDEHYPLALSVPQRCPTCGADEPGGGTCGTGPDDTRALCHGLWPWTTPTTTGGA